MAASTVLFAMGPVFAADMSVELESSGPVYEKIDGRLNNAQDPVSHDPNSYEQAQPTIETAGPKSDAEARERKKQAQLAEKTAPKGDSLQPRQAAVSPSAVVTPPAATLGSGRKIDYVAISQPVEQVIKELGQAVGLRVVAGSGVSGTVRKRHFKGDFPVLMDSLAQEFGLFWFADGGVVYAETLEGQKTRIVALKNTGAEQLYETMDLMGLGRVKSHVLVSPGEGNVRVTGPDSLQKAIDNILATLKPPEDPEIKVIKYGTRVSN